MGKPMFVSLNRKIIYSIVALFLITSLIFVYTFYIIYGNKIQEDQRYSIQRNQQYIDLLFKNIVVSKEFRHVLENNPHIVIPDYVSNYLASGVNAENRLTLEQRQIQEINKSYEDRYAAIPESLRILGISSILLILSIIFLGYLISRWILTPLNRISTVSSQVADGRLNIRIKSEKTPIFKDELDNLTDTFNQMLDKLENYLSEIKEKETFLQALIDNVPDGIRVTDTAGNLIVANKAYHKQKADKSAFISVNSAPLQIGHREPLTVESLHDLSADINFSHRQKLSSLGFLSTSIAHEMKNNLGALRIILERIISKYYENLPETDEAKKHLNLVYNQLISCIDLPERLLKLTRSSSETSQTVCCKSCMRDVIAMMDFEAKSKGMTINLDCEDETLAFKGNEADFKMIALNLILNALNAMTAGGHLNIKIFRPSPRKVNISFCDTGCGIAPEKLEQIFEPFYTASESRSAQGNGLGLPIVKSLATKYKGTINVISTPGCGSEFTLSFPAIKNLAKK